MLWQDPSGKTSPLRAAALALVTLPAVWIAAQALMDDLGPRPVTAAIHQTGDWALRLLWLTLLISPLRRLLDWPRAAAVRRTFGLAAFAYTAAHLILYTAELKFDLSRLTSEIFQRIYLGIGFSAVVALAILAATSTDSAVKRLGADGWRALHTLIFPATVLALVHFFIQTKLKVTQPVLMSGLLVWLLGWRWLETRRLSHTAGLIGLAVVAAVATMAIETAWYGLFTGVSATRIFYANFDFAYEIRMMWWVLLAGFCAALVQATRGRPPAKR